MGQVGINGQVGAALAPPDAEDPPPTTRHPTPAQQARRLGAARRRLFLASTAAGLALPFAIWASGLSAVWWGSLAWLPLDHWPALAVFVLLVLLVLTLGGLPFSWYGGYRLSHRFKLSRQSARAWLADWLKAALLGLLLGGLALLVFYAAIALAGPAWWLLFATAACLATLFLTFVAPYVILPLFYRLQPLEDETVVRAIRELAADAKAEVREVSTLDFSRKTVEANAAVIGIGRSRRVVLADTLLTEFSLPEVRSVVAHELGHHVHRDVPRLLLVQGALIWSGSALAGLLGESLLRRWAYAVRPDELSGGLAEPANLPLLLFAAQLFGLLSMPLVNALSRRLESAADTFALKLTDDPAAFISAMRKLADQNLAEAQPPRWAELLLHSHPAFARRIRAAETCR